MKVLRYEHKNGWVTRVLYRKSMHDLVISQYKKHYKKDNGEYRQIYLFDDNIDVIKELLLFLKGIKRV